MHLDLSIALAQAIGHIGGTEAVGKPGSRVSLLDSLDAGLFAFAGLSMLWLAWLLARESVRPGWPLLLLVVF